MNTSRTLLDERRDRIHQGAMAVIDAEREARIAKTEKLRAQRLALSAAEEAKSATADH